MAILKVHAQKIPIEIVNNSVFPDDKVYVAIIGKKVSDDAPIYYDLIANNASDAALRALTVNTNTLHKSNGDRGYANVFTTLDKIKTKPFTWIKPMLAVCFWFQFTALPTRKR